jgi:hypothetical protein
MRKRLGHRQAEAFCETRHQKGACATQQRRKPGIRHSPKLDHMPLQRGTAVQQVEDIFVPVYPFSSASSLAINRHLPHA